MLIYNGFNIDSNSNVFSGFVRKLPIFYKYIYINILQLMHFSATEVEVIVNLMNYVSYILLQYSLYCFPMSNLTEKVSQNRKLLKTKVQNIRLNHRHFGFLTLLTSPIGIWKIRLLENWWLSS